MEVTTFIVLCGLGTVLFSAAARDLSSALAMWIGGFAAMTVLANPALLQLPLRPVVGMESTQLATLLVLACIAALLRPRPRGLFVALGGALAALWVLGWAAQGWPALAAAGVAGGLSLAALLSAVYRPGFCTDAMRDEALVIVMAASLLLAVVPEVIGGWQAAPGVRGLQHDAAIDTLGRAVLLIVGLSVVVGGLYAGWKRR